MSRRIWALVISAVPLLLIGGIYGWIRSVESRRWARFESLLAEIKIQAGRREVRRPVLRGEPLPGRAWADYYAAFAIQRPPGLLEGVDLYLKRLPGADAGSLDVLLAADVAALNLLRTGVRREVGAFSRKDSEGVPSIGGVFEKTISLGNRALCQARRWAERGKVREAADLILDVALYGRDLGDDTLRAESGLVLSMSALNELRGLWIAGGLSPVDRSGIEQQLSRLEEGLPRMRDSILGEAVITGNFLKDWGQSDGGLNATWRYGFSRKIELSERFDQLMFRLRRQAEADEMPWRSAQAVDFSVDDGGRSVSGGAKAARLIRHRRTWKAQVRLLRTALGAGVVLDDPFGGTLRSDGSKVWSFGPNGADDGGVGAWEPSAAGDMVLELTPSK